MHAPCAWDILIHLMMEKGVRSRIPQGHYCLRQCQPFYVLCSPADKEGLFESQVNRMLGTLIEDTPQDVLEGNPYSPSLGLFRHVQEQLHAM
jgi:hypothetical protein